MNRPMIPSSLSATSPERDRSAVIQVVAGILVPAGIALIAPFSRSTSRFYGLLALAGISVLVSGHEMTWRWAKQLFYVQRERRFSRRIRPRLCQLVARFGEFVGDRNDTVEYIVRNDIFRGRAEIGAKIVVMDRYLFWELWSELSRRLSTRGSGIGELHGRLGELLTLYIAYVRYCMDPIFDSCPSDVRASLDARVVSDLEDVRERFAHLRYDLAEIAKEIEENSYTQPFRPVFLPRPKPLVVQQNSTG
jgi:hypothetical protein